MSFALRTAVLVSRHEWRVLVADRSLLLTSVLLTAFIGYALYNGLIETVSREKALAQLEQKQQAQQQSNIALLRRIMAGTEKPTPFANPADPTSVGGGLGARYAIMPAAPLAPLAFGQSDLLPSYYKVTYGSKNAFMYDTEIENPWNLLSGHFDLAFVVVYLLPLLIFALSYNLLSGEREQGTLRMLLSQPLGLASILLGKVAIRALSILAIGLVVPLVILVVTRPEIRTSTQLISLLAWIGITAAYALFWFGLAIAVNTLGRSSAANALILIVIWVLLVLVVPVLLNVGVAIASPTPSRAELATRTRLVTTTGLTRYQDQLSTDYSYVEKPESLAPKDGKIEIGARLQGYYLMQKDVDTEIDGILEQFNTQLAGQQALVDRLGILSPAIVIHEGLTALAGSGSQRYRRFQRQVEAYHQSWRQFLEPRILSGIAITEADFERMPRFAWQEESASGALADVFGRLLQVLLPALLLFGIGIWRARRYRVL